MSVDETIEAGLEHALALSDNDHCPPRLRAAMRYAVFPGGHRIRPRLTAAVATAYIEPMDAVMSTAMSSIELLHCASLVHDDMPCFDDADMRRGKPSVHVAYGQDLALLCGDALIVLAFQSIAAVAGQNPRRCAELLAVVAGGVGAPQGIVAGQAWECEPSANTEEYQRGKTGALFAAATMAGAAAVGEDPAPWRALGEHMGAAYQVADDLVDRFGDPERVGKPCNRDRQLSRPNAISEYGVDGATRRLDRVLDALIDTIPDCPGRSRLSALIRDEAARFTNEALRARAAA